MSGGFPCAPAGQSWHRHVSTSSPSPYPEPPTSRKGAGFCKCPLHPAQRGKPETAIWLRWAKSCRMTNPFQLHFLPHRQTHPPLSDTLTFTYPHTKTPSYPTQTYTQNGHALHTLAHKYRYLRARTHTHTHIPLSPYPSVTDT